MKVTQEQIESLSQLDRIEYKMEVKELDEEFSSSITFGIMYIFMFVFLVLIILDTWQFNYTGETILAEILDSIGKTVGIIFATACLGDIALVCIYCYRRKQLDEKFFNFKVNPKRK